MHPSILPFVQSVISPDDIHGHDVIEVGSLDVNGSVRPWITSHSPASYLGIDMRPGPSVDISCCFEDYPLHRTYPIVVCVEVLEHVERIQPFIDKLKLALAPAGRLIITTRSPGFPRHGYPDDFWRYTQRDMLALFSDLTITHLEDDPHPGHPGVFLCARKPTDWHLIPTTHTPGRVS